MNLQALLVSSDDSAADVLGRVLSSFGIATDRSSDPETTMVRIQQQKFDALVVEANVVDWVLARAKVEDTPVPFETLMQPTDNRSAPAGGLAGPQAANDATIERTRHINRESDNFHSKTNRIRIALMEPL